MSTEKNALSFIGESDNGAGFEGITMETMAVPFITLLQKGSPQVNEKKPEYIAGAKAGMYFNSATKHLYCEKLEVIVLSFDHIYTEWKPGRGGFIARHSSVEGDRLAVDKSVFGKWKTAEGNDLVETYTYFCLVVGDELAGPVVLSLTASNISIAKAWNRMMIANVMPNGKRAMPYYLKWAVSSAYAENDKGDWYKFSVSFQGYISEEQYQVIVPERQTLSSKQVDYAQITNDSTASPKEDVPF